MIGCRSLASIGHGSTESGSVLVAVCVSLKHLRPVKARLLIRVRASIHRHPILTGGHTILTGRHAVARHGLAIHSVLHLVAAVGLRTTHRGRTGRHGPAISVRVVESANAAGARHVVLVGAHVAHAVLDGHHAEGVLTHVLLRHVVKAVELVEVALLAGSGALSMLLDVRLGVRKMANARRVAAANGALLEVTLEDVTSREGIPAKYTHVRTVASVSEKMTLQVLRVQVRLGAVRAWEFAIGVLDRDDRAFGPSTSGRCSGATRGTGQDTSTTLRTDDVRGLFAFGNHGLLLMLLHHLATRPIRRRRAGLLRHDATRRHRSQDRRTAVATRRSRCNGLRPRGGCGRLGHHTARRRVTRLRLVLVVLLGRHRVHATARSWLRSLLLVARQIGMV